MTHHDEHTHDEEPTEEEIQQFIAEQQEFLNALATRINTILDESGLTEEDGERFGDPNAILDALQTALGTSDDAKKLLGIVASLIGTNVQLGMMIQQILAQSQQSAFDQLLAEQEELGIN